MKIEAAVGQVTYSHSAMASKESSQSPDLHFVAVKSEEGRSSQTAPPALSATELLATVKVVVRRVVAG